MADTFYADTDMKRGSFAVHYVVVRRRDGRVVSRHSKYSAAADKADRLNREAA